MLLYIFLHINWFVEVQFSRSWWNHVGRLDTFRYASNIQFLVNIYMQYHEKRTKFLFFIKKKWILTNWNFYIGILYYYFPQDTCSYFFINFMTFFIHIRVCFLIWAEANNLYTINSVTIQNVNNILHVTC